MMRERDDALPFFQPMKLEGELIPANDIRQQGLVSLVRVRSWTVINGHGWSWTVINGHVDGHGWS